MLFPYSVSAHNNGIYGLVLMLIFTFIITIGFIFELGKNALKISSRQDNLIKNPSSKKIISLFSVSNGMTNKGKVNLSSTRRSYSTNNNNKTFSFPKDRKRGKVFLRK